MKTNVVNISTNISDKVLGLKLWAKMLPANQTAGLFEM